MKKILFILLFPVLLLAQFGGWGSSKYINLLPLNNTWTGTNTYSGLATFNANIALPSTGWIGLGSGAARFIFTDVGGSTVDLIEINNGRMQYTASATGVYMLQVINSHATNGYGLHLRAGDDNTVNTMLLENYLGVDLLRVRGAGETTLNGAFNFFTDSSTVNDSWGFVDASSITSLQTGLQVFVQIAVANTDGATLQINALGAKNVLKLHDQALVTGDVEVGQILHLIYDGTSWQMLSQLAQ